jgi:hypothetical protein
LPALSTTTAEGKFTSALTAGLPSPENPAVPLPTEAEMVYTGADCA